MIRLWNTILKTLTGSLREQPVATAPVSPPEPAAPDRKRGRPPSPALLRTIELVRERRNITHREVAEEVGVTPDYARTLLRRAQTKAPLLVPAVPARHDLAATVADLQTRLEDAEQTLSALRTTPPQSRGSWNFNRRAEVLRLLASGVAPGEIASTLSIPAGEVEFILKVDRQLNTAG